MSVHGTSRRIAPQRNLGRFESEADVASSRYAGRSRRPRSCGVDCDPHRGRFVAPIKNLSIDCAQRRPSRMAQTTSDWPRRMSPAENTFGREVW
jgi:hypothetical protein